MLAFAVDTTDSAPSSSPPCGDPDLVHNLLHLQCSVEKYVLKNLIAHTHTKNFCLNSC